MSRDIDYGNLMHSAMRGLIRTVLEDVAEHGLPGNHHFFITFDTTHPDAQLAEWLADRLKYYGANPEQIKQMSIAAKGASVADATQVVAEQVIKQIRLTD